MTAHLGLTYSNKIEENLLVTQKYNDNQIVIWIIARQCLLTVNDEKQVHACYFIFISKQPRGLDQR